MFDTHTLERKHTIKAKLVVLRACVGQVGILDGAVRHRLHGQAVRLVAQSLVAAISARLVCTIQRLVQQIHQTHGVARARFEFL